MEYGDRANQESSRDLRFHIKDISNPEEAYEEMYLEQTAEHTRAFLKVQDGCNQFCSYCIIPYARGRMVHELAGICRIRLGSLEPNIITEEFVKAIAALPKVCPHFHLSLQSGCDETLKRMNRKYDTASYAAKCELLRTYYEHPAITTDVIVGFPGETEEEFLKTKEFLEKVCFYEMHIFKYSKRKGTKAARMEHQISEEVKTQRSGILLEQERKMSEEFREYYIGIYERVCESCDRNG